jgi:methionyl-tRNA synthetase
VRDRGFIYKDRYEGGTARWTRCSFTETQLVMGAVRSAATRGETRGRELLLPAVAFQQPLLDHYRNHPDFVTPAVRRNEMLSFLEAGLEDLSVSRTSFTWGIPVPDDPAHVMYVWFDALTNYMTAAGYGSDDRRRGALREVLAGRRAPDWQGDRRQHAIYWPAFLLAAGLPLPRQVVSHGWWLMEGAKMSKSKGNVVRAPTTSSASVSTGSATSCIREMIFGQDASFTDEAIPHAVQRRPRERSRQPRESRDDDDSPDVRRTRAAPAARLLERDEERAMLNAASTLIGQVKAAVGSFQLSVALREIWDLVGRHESLHRGSRAMAPGEG